MRSWTSENPTSRTADDACGRSAAGRSAPARPTTTSPPPRRGSRASRPPHAGPDLPHRRRASSAPSCSSSARTSSASARSSSAARSTRCRSFDARAAPRRRRRVLLGQPRAGDRAGGAAARHAGGDRHAARRAGREGRRDPGLRRRGRRSTTATREDREAIGRRLAEERGLTLIPPYDHPDVIAGQGTAAQGAVRGGRPARRAVRLPRRRRPARRARALAARALSPGCKVYRRRAGGRQRRPAVVPQRRDRAHRDAAARSPTARRRTHLGELHLRDHPARRRRHPHRDRRRSWSRRCGSSPSA